MNRRILIPAIAAAALVAGAFVFAQTAPTSAPPKPDNEKDGVIHFQTNIGSFKFIDGKGTLDMNFSGTMLIVGLKGTATPAGSLRKEYDDRGRQAYHGTGHILISGNFRGIQWFGTGLSGTWTGRGIARLTGEFDNKLETGTYWYDDPNNKLPWGMYGSTITVPEMIMGGAGNPTERKTGGGTAPAPSESKASSAPTPVERKPQTKGGP